MNLTEAIFCAHLLTGIPVNTNILPVWENRLPTKLEIKLSNKPEIAKAVFIKLRDFRTPFIIANEWKYLVHESVHFLQWSNGIPYSEISKSRYETQADYAESHANECLTKQ